VVYFWDEGRAAYITIEVDDLVELNRLGLGSDQHAELEAGCQQRQTE
jgi:hypothetical protein